MFNPRWPVVRRPVIRRPVPVAETPVPVPVKGRAKPGRIHRGPSVERIVEKSVTISHRVVIVERPIPAMVMKSGSKNNRGTVNIGSGVSGCESGIYHPVRILIDMDILYIVHRIAGRYICNTLGTVGGNLPGTLGT